MKGQVKMEDNFGRCWHCGQLDELGEHDQLCESCYVELRDEERSEPVKPDKAEQDHEDLLKWVASGLMAIHQSRKTGDQSALRAWRTKSGTNDQP